MIAHSKLVAEPPVHVYQCRRTESNSLDSTVRLTLQLELSDRAINYLNQAYESRVEGGTSPKDVRPRPIKSPLLNEVLRQMIDVDVVYQDFTLPTFFAPDDTDEDCTTGKMTVVPKPSVDVTMEETGANVVDIHVLPRTLPISSTHQGRPFRLIISINGMEYVTTAPFYVSAKEMSRESRQGHRPRGMTMRRARDCKRDNTRIAKLKTAVQAAVTELAGFDFWDDDNRQLVLSVAQVAGLQHKQAMPLPVAAASKRKLVSPLATQEMDAGGRLPHPPPTTGARPYYERDDTASVPQVKRPRLETSTVPPLPVYPPFGESSAEGYLDGYADPHMHAPPSHMLLKQETGSQSAYAHGVPAYRVAEPYVSPVEESVRPYGEIAYQSSSQYTMPPHALPYAAGASYADMSGEPSYSYEPRHVYSHLPAYRQQLPPAHMTVPQRSFGMGGGAAGSISGHNALQMAPPRSAHAAYAAQSHMNSSHAGSHPSMGSGLPHRAFNPEHSR